MSARRPRIPLICSALLGVLVISCGGPPVYVVAPVPAAAPQVSLQQPQGGLQEAAPPAPVQAAPPPLAPEALAPPAPRAAPPAAPAELPPPAVAPPAPPRRPGGAPPGTERVTLPGGQVPLRQWLSGMDSACQGAHYQPGCLNLNKNFNPKKGPHPPDKCTVDSQSPDMGKKVTTSTRVTLNIECPQTNGTGGSGKKVGSDSNDKTDQQGP
jgi:hypothetical protein